MCVLHCVAACLIRLLVNWVQEASPTSAARVDTASSDELVDAEGDDGLQQVTPLAPSGRPEACKGPGTQAHLAWAGACTGTGLVRQESTSTSKCWLLCWQSGLD